MYDHDTAPAFDQIPGVPLSPMISDRILTGMASGPGGFNPGVSGGGTYDNQGRLLAAMSAIQLIGIGSVGKSVDVPATSIYDATTAWQQGQNMTSWFMANADHQRLNVFSTDRGVMAPLGQPEILGLLGNAGRNSTAAPADVPDHVDARLVGFPNGKCAVYTASLEAYDPHNPLHQISIDRKDVLGPTDPVRPNGVRIGKDGMIIAYDDRGKVHLVVMPDGSRREFDNGVPIARGLASPEEPAAAQGPR
jgi:hypothetical protein